MLRQPVEHRPEIIPSESVTILKSVLTDADGPAGMVMQLKLGQAGECVIANAGYTVWKRNRA